MELSKLKREIEDMESFESKISLFNKHWIKSNKYGFLKYEDKERLKALRQVIKELKYGQIVNEKIISLVNNLFRLRVCKLNNDGQEFSKIMKKFLSDDHINIRKVIDEVNYIELQLGLFKDFYEKILYKLGKRLDLEDNLELVDGKHAVYLQEMINLNKKQKGYLKEIGSKFVEIGKG